MTRRQRNRLRRHNGIDDRDRTRDDDRRASGTDRQPDENASEADDCRHHNGRYHHRAADYKGHHSGGLHPGQDLFASGKQGRGFIQ